MTNKTFKEKLSEFWKKIKDNCIIIVSSIGAFLLAVLLGKSVHDNRKSVDGAGDNNKRAVKDAERTEDAINRSIDANTKLADGTERAAEIIKEIKATKH